MKSALLLLAPIITLGCNSALVGGACLDGYVERGHDCVEAPSRDTSAQSGTGGEGGSNGMSGSGGGASSSVTGTSQVSTSSTGATGSGCGSLTACSDGCYDVTNDPLHCGDCGTTCSTGLCVASQCEGSVAGHVVVMGLSFDNVGPGTAASRLLGNSVFLSPHSPLRLLDYHALSSADAASHVDTLIGSEAAARGRSLTTNVALDGASVTDSLSSNSADVFVLHVPVNAKLSDVDALGSQWSQPLFTFGKAGGVVVVLVEKDDSDFLAAMLDESNLLSGVGASNAAFGPFVVNDFLDSVTAGIPSPFNVPEPSVGLTYAAAISPTLSIPVVDASNGPMVIHRVVPPLQ